MSKIFINSKYSNKKSPYKIREFYGLGTWDDACLLTKAGSDYYPGEN